MEAAVKKFFPSSVRRLGHAFIAGTALFALMPTNAQAFQITVDGQPYEITTEDTTWNAIRNDVIGAVPWWGIEDDAVSFAEDAFNQQGETFVEFAYGETKDRFENVTGTLTAFVNDDGDATTGGLADSVGSTYAISAEAVPEIDGSALSQATGILTVLLLALIGRRQWRQSRAAG